MEQTEFKQSMKNFILFSVGFCSYSIIEFLFRGYTFVTMGIVGGVAFWMIDKINDKISWDMDIIVQGIMGSGIVTFWELLIGLVRLYKNLPPMWDYSNMPLNYKGIICVPFSLIWILVSIVGIFVADYINYYIFKEEPCPYYNLFGKTILRYPQDN